MIIQLCPHYCLTSQILLGFLSSSCLIFCYLNYSLYNRLNPKFDVDYSTLVSIPSIERDLIVSYLNRSQKMIEYGSGYSTLYFSQFVDSYYSIEHDAEWFEQIRKLMFYSSNSKGSIKDYALSRVEAGYRGWAGGKAEGSFVQFKQYVETVRKFQVEKFDRVLIDGRARVHCIREIYRFLHPDSIVFYHGRFLKRSVDAMTRGYYRKIFETHREHPLLAYRPIFFPNSTLIY